MDPISVFAASGLRSRMESLDMLANNLANAGTSGFKGDQEFYSLYTSEAAEPDALGDKATLPVIDRPWTDFSQGLLQTTKNPLDLALSGKGFFVVNGPSGPLYTRNGSFQLSAAGVLTAADGLPVRAQGGGTITVDPAMPVQVASDGSVEQNGAVVAQLDLVTFSNPAVLSKQGSAYFLNTDATVKPQPALNVEVHQGSVEASNIKTPEAAVHLVSVMRQFEMLHKAINISVDMNKKAEDVARVGS